MVCGTYGMGVIEFEDNPVRLISEILRFFICGAKNGIRKSIFNYY